MTDTVYRVEVKYPVEGGRWLKAADRGRWIALPRRPGTRPTEHLSAARATLTNLRNQANRYHADDRPLYRIVELSGQWKARPE